MEGTDYVADRVAQDIAAYQVPIVHEGVGVSLGAEWHHRQLAALKAALIAPYAAQMRDERDGQLAVLSVQVVADDGEGAIVVFDPEADEFVLAVSDPDPVPSRNVNLVSCGVRGELVGCFMSA